MAITAAALTGSNSTTDASSYNTASITPTADRLVLAAVLSKKASAPDTPTLSGNGLTWVQVATVTFHTIGTPILRLTLFRAMGASPSTGAVTIDFGGATQLSCAWSLVEFADIDTGGTNGSAAVVQSATNAADAVAAQALLTVTLAAFGSAGNATYGAFGSSNVTTTETVVGSGFTQLHRTGGVDPRTLLTEWRADNDTSVDAENDEASDTRDMAGIAVEIKAVSAGATHPGWYGQKGGWW